MVKAYVETLYQLRQDYPREHPLNYIAKISLNSLYGRFGMDDNFSIIEIIDSNFRPGIETAGDRPA